MTSELFGTTLRYFRGQSHNPRTGRPLTQEALAEMLDISTATISNWETGKKRPYADERVRLLQLIGVLVDCGGITTMVEANRLLAAGDYRGLDDTERRQWIPGLYNAAAGDADPAHESEGYPAADSHVRRRAVWFDLRKQMRLPDVPPDESGLAAWTIGLLRAAAGLVKPEGVLRLLLVLGLWLVAIAGWQRLLAWWPAEDRLAGQGTFAFGAASALIPLLLGLLLRADRQAELAARGVRRQDLIFLRTMGALIGYQVGGAAVLLVFLVLFYLGVWPVAPAAIALPAAIPLLIAYASLRQMPDSYASAFATVRGEGLHLRVDHRDWLIAATFLALGPLLAAFLYTFRAILLHPLYGAVSIGAALALVAARQLLQRRA